MSQKQNIWLSESSASKYLVIPGIIAGFMLYVATWAIGFLWIVKENDFLVAFLGSGVTPREILGWAAIILPNIVPGALFLSFWRHRQFLAYGFMGGSLIAFMIFLRYILMTMYQDAHGLL